VALADGQDLSFGICGDGVGIDSAVSDTGTNGHFGFKVLPPKSGGSQNKDFEYLAEMPNGQPAKFAT